MNTTFKKIWEKAKPYYEKGRPMDISHIEWMMKRVDEVCSIEKIDISILMPLAILHDVGYATLINPATANYYGKDIRKAHMKAGSEIAKKILESTDYPSDKSKKIIEYVGVHDNWAFGEVQMYIEDKLLGTFKDLDYLWIYTKEGCAPIQKTLKKTNVGMLKHLEDERTPIFNKKPFSTEYTKQLRETYLKQRENDLKD